MSAIEANPKTARVIQQELAVQNGFKGQLMWDLFKREEKDDLGERLKYLIPDAIVDVDSINNNTAFNESQKKEKIAVDEKEAKKYNKKMEEVRANLLNSIWAQRKYSNGNILFSIVYVVLAPARASSEVLLSRSLNATEYCLHPVVRLRKCMNANGDSENCCMIFIDENARVYQSWENFLIHNLLPAGVLVAPKGGIYKFDNQEMVILDCVDSPASSNVSTILNAADVGTSIAGFGAAIVPAAALFLPVAAPVMAGAAVAAVGSGVYSMGRSAFNLYDRGAHEQSVSVTDRQARGSWLGVVGGAFSLGATAATRLLGRYAAAGTEISVLFRTTVNGANIATIMISGAGVGNGLMELFLKWNDDDEISALEVVQLSASLVLFTHSVYNFQLASKIIENRQNETISEFKNELSRRQRKMFVKMEKETIRIRGSNQGRVDIVRSLKKIPDKQFLNDLYKINKNLNQKNIRPSFSGNEKIALNGEIAVDAGVLRQNVQHNIGENILGQVNAPIPSTVELNINSQLHVDMPISASEAYKILSIVTRTAGHFYVLSKSDLGNCLVEIYEHMLHEVADYLYTAATAAYMKMKSRLENIVRRAVPFEEFLWELYTLIMTNYRTNPISKRCLKESMHSFLESLLKVFEENFGMPVGERIACPNCSGFYTFLNTA